MFARPRFTSVTTCVISFFLGFTAFLIMFVIVAITDDPGENSIPIRETVASCLVGAVYLGFCQYWVAPRGRSGFWAKVPTLAAMIAPLLCIGLLVLLGEGQMIGVFWLAFGFLGCIVGAGLAARVAPSVIAEGASTDRGRISSDPPPMVGAG